MFFIANIANNMGPDQTAIGAISLETENCLTVNSRVYFKTECKMSIICRQKMIHMQSHIFFIENQENYSQKSYKIKELQ